MPHATVTGGPAGTSDIYYNISTPDNYSAPAIDPALPCILFVHSEWVSQDIFEPQFSDALLRKHFNLIAMDTRAHGRSSGPVGQDFTLQAAGEEIFRFQQTLNLPPLHVFGISIGCNIVLEFAQAHPDRVLSLTLCSLPPPKEPDEVMAGRRQIFEFWTNSFKQDGEKLTADSLVEAGMLSEMIHGGMQLLFSGRISHVVYPLINKLLQHVVNNWAGSAEKTEASRRVSLGWFEEKGEWDFAALDKVKCPIIVIHNSANIGYGDIKPTERFVKTLRDMGHSNARLLSVDGAHLSIITNPETINEIIFNTTVTTSYGQERLEQLLEAQSTKTLYAMQTPFTSELVRFGYEPNDEYEELSSGMPDLEPSYPLSEFGLKSFMEDHYPVK